MPELRRLEKLEPQIKHQRQYFWQILFPVITSLTVVIILLIFAVLTTGNTPTVNEKWANISVVFLILPAIFFGLLTLAVIILLTIGFRKLHKVIPFYTGNFYDALKQADQLTNETTAIGLSPLIQGKAYIAGFKRLFSMAFHITNDREE